MKPLLIRILGIGTLVLSGLALSSCVERREDNKGSSLPNFINPYHHLNPKNIIDPMYHLNPLNRLSPLYNNPINKLSPFYGPEENDEGFFDFGDD